MMKTKLFIIFCVIMCLMSSVVCAEEISTYTVNCDVLNIRSEPSTSSAILGVFYYNKEILGGQPENGWVPIYYGDRRAYVYAAYLTKKTDAPAPAPTQPQENLVYIGTYRITGYDICYSCCGKVDGITASGTKATPGRTIAMKGYPYGTKVYIENIGYRTVEDTGGFSYNAIDVLCNNHAECYAITGYQKVYLVK